MSLETKEIDAITPDLLTQFKTELPDNPQQRVLMNAIQKSGIESVALNQASLINMQYTFSTEIKTGAITNQKQSGRCWMFAGLNVLRNRVASACKLDSFELSQNFQMFWDKFEKANYFLENILHTLDEDTSGRLVSWLLMSPVQDGGQWDMFVNLVDKYGIVPKHVMPETYHSSKTAVMNRLLTAKLREDAARLRKQFHDSKASIDSLRQQKTTMLQEIYTMLCSFLGTPPTQFDFEYRDLDNAFHQDVQLTPQAFYKKYVDIDLSDYVSVIHAPTNDKPFGKTYTVSYLGNVVGGKDVLYLNVEIETLRALTQAQLEDGEPVWFGCDVGKMLDRESGIMDTSLYDYAAALNVPFHMTKAERLDYSESLMTHAMVFTGMNVLDGKVNRWKVENSWGTDTGHQGFFIMSDQWFDEFMYQIVVHKKYLSASLQAALVQPPAALQPWDPMGSLAGPSA